jgi:hypothetical protein
MLPRVFLEGQQFKNIISFSERFKLTKLEAKLTKDLFIVTCNTDKRCRLKKVLYLFFKCIYNDASYSYIYSDIFHVWSDISSIEKDSRNDFLLYWRV